jgi:hypothetical protein
LVLYIANQNGLVWKEFRDFLAAFFAPDDVDDLRPRLLNGPTDEICHALFVGHAENNDSATF